MNIKGYIEYKAFSHLHPTQYKDNEQLGNSQYCKNNRGDKFIAQNIDIIICNVCDNVALVVDESTLICALGVYWVLRGTILSSGRGHSV